MKQLVYNIKEFLHELKVLIKAGIKNSYYNDTAYISENWGNIISTAVFTISYILFIDILYSRVTFLAGYNRDELVFLGLIAQLGFYISHIVYGNSVMRLPGFVNRGHLDVVMTKPVRTDMYISLQRISVITAIRDSILPTAVFIYQIDWSNIHTTSISILVGVIIFALGLYADYCLMFIARLPAFWSGKAHAFAALLDNVRWSIRKEVPLEGYSGLATGFFTVLFPSILVSAVATSAFLQKSDLRYLLLISIIGAALIGALRKTLWALALKSYSSASS